MYQDESFMVLGHLGRWVVRQGTVHTSVKTPSQGYDVMCLVLFADGSSLQ